MRRTTIIAAVLACVLAMPTAALAEPPPKTAVRIEVDVSALPKADFPENTRRWIVDNQTAVLQREGFVVKDDASHVMRIEVSRYGEDGIHTKARLMLQGDPDSVREFTCEACLNSQFLKKVDAETAVLAGELRRELMAAEQEAEPEPAGEPEVVAATDTMESHEARTASDEPADHEGKRLGAIGFAGIGALAVGAGLTLGGVIVLVEEPRVRIPAEDTLVEEVTTRDRLGTGLAVAGASLLVSGVVLVIVDQTVLRKKRDKHSAAAVLHPSLSPAGFGVSITGRF
jgi:hypothetical protein